jgi:hypothetical protein
MSNKIETGKLKWEGAPQSWKTLSKLGSDFGFFAVYRFSDFFGVGLVADFAMRSSYFN